MQNGQVINETTVQTETTAPMTWTVIDSVTRKSKTFDQEPSNQDLLTFKRELGYTSMKIEHVNNEERTVYLRPNDVSGH